MEFLNGIIDALSKFFDWYLHDTTLLEDTLDAGYLMLVHAYNTFMPVLKEYIDLIAAYIHQ
jgi:hypothetical protein